MILKSIIILSSSILSIIIRYSLIYQRGIFKIRRNRATLNIIVDKTVIVTIVRKIMMISTLTTHNLREGCNQGLLARVIKAQTFYDADS